MANRRDAKERFWRQVIARHRASGLSIRAFCECEGLTESSFFLWRRELARRTEPGRAAWATIVPVRVVPDPSAAAAAIEIALPSGTVVRLRAGFDEQALRQVLAALAEGQPC
jgi:transposase